MFYRCITASLCVFVAACSPALQPQTGKVASGQVVTCRDVTPTGSNVPRRVCSSVSERDAQRDDSQRTLEQRVFRPGGAGDKNPSSL
jgi:hypothetical protein